ncbi:MAG: hypothetical protein KGI84_10490, partial [Elusimicrobia bacterium]|nr:hypothetical protein [Elusimicrobiota bacterium]
WVLLRPAALDVVSQYFHPNAAWLGAGSTPASALEKVFLIFLYGWQGQWLFHWRTGILFWLLAGILIWRRRGTVQGEDTRFFGLISAGFLSAVGFCFAALPFIGDVTVSPGRDYLAKYLQFISVGMGRMTSHLYPFLILWALASVRDGEAERLEFLQARPDPSRQQKYASPS